MATTFIIGGTSYSFPVQGENPPYGENVTDTIAALVAVVNTLSGTGDILTTSFTIANNVSSAANVTGLNFDPSVVRGAIVDYSIYRSSSNPNELSETGTMYLAYKSTAATWELAQTYGGSSGVTFTITNGGQVKYTSSEIGSGSYVGRMVFKARSFSQT